jgi:hypothetical protein
LAKVLKLRPSHFQSQDLSDAESEVRQEVKGRAKTIFVLAFTIECTGLIYRRSEDIRLPELQGGVRRTGYVLVNGDRS